MTHLLWSHNHCDVKVKTQYIIIILLNQRFPRITSFTYSSENCRSSIWPRPSETLQRKHRKPSGCVNLIVSSSQQAIKICPERWRNCPLFQKPTEHARSSFSHRAGEFWHSHYSRCSQLLSLSLPPFVAPSLYYVLRQSYAAMSLPYVQLTVSRTSYQHSEHASLLVPLMRELHNKWTFGSGTTPSIHVIFHTRAWSQRRRIWAPPRSPPYCKKWLFNQDGALEPGDWGSGLN